MEGQPLREKTYHLYLNEEERSRVIQSLIELKNNLAAQGRYTDAVDDTLKEEYDIGASFYLVGSGARNLILQNANRPIDLDYNLEITRIDDWEDCKEIKECVRKAFNIVLREYDS